MRHLLHHVLLTITDKEDATNCNPQRKYKGLQLLKDEALKPKYVFEVPACASWAISVDTWPLAADKWNFKPDPINGTFRDRSKQSRKSEELLPCFFHGNENVRDSKSKMIDQKDKANPS